MTNKQVGSNFTHTCGIFNTEKKTSEVNCKQCKNHAKMIKNHKALMNHLEKYQVEAIAYFGKGK